MLAAILFQAVDAKHPGYYFSGVLHRSGVFHHDGLDRLTDFLADITAMFQTVEDAGPGDNFDWVI